MASQTAADGPTPVFDPYTQQITIMVDPETPFPVGVADIDEWLGYAVRININYASQIGASILLLVVLLLITKDDKRKSPIFILNALALAANAISNILGCMYFTGPWYEFITYFLGDYSRVPRSQYGISVAADVLTHILLMCVEASLVLQVRAVCVTLRDPYKRILFILSIGIAVTASAIRLWLNVENSKAIMNAEDFGDFEWLAATSQYVITASICFFSAVFVGKLGVALNERRKMGLKQFGPMQVIFIMGCQTLIIPGKSCNALMSSYTPC